MELWDFGLGEEVVVDIFNILGVFWSWGGGCLEWRGMITIDLTFVPA